MGMCQQKATEAEPLRDLYIPSEAFLFKEVTRWPQEMSNVS